jgi:hypothetical protein
MRIRIRGLLILAALLSAAAAIRATTLARLNLDQLASAANAIARVRCAAVESRWENGGIWTVTTFDVVETMKGTLAAQITVRLPGGRVGHLTAAVDGTPRFIPREMAIVFLESSRAGGFTVAGWVEGTFRIERDPRTGHENVTQDSSTFAVFDTATRTFRTEGIRRMPIEKFREGVTAAIARTQGETR